MCEQEVPESSSPFTKQASGHSQANPEKSRDLKGTESKAKEAEKAAPAPPQKFSANCKVRFFKDTIVYTVSATIKATFRNCHF